MSSRKQTLWEILSTFVFAFIFVCGQVMASDVECRSQSERNELIFQMGLHYVPVVTKVGDKDFNYGSGIIINPSMVLTSFHMLKPFGMTQLKDGNSPDRISSIPGSDLAILQFHKELFKNTPRLEPAMVNMGDRVYGYSNSYNLDGAYQEYTVSKVTSELIFISPSMGKGSSGSAIYNCKGQLVGIVSGARITENDDPGIGFLIPVSVFEKLLSYDVSK
jgi:hypothetical protein